MSPDVAGLGGRGCAQVRPPSPREASQGFSVRSLPGRGPLEGFVRGLPQHFSLQVVEHSHPQQNPVPGQQRGTHASTQVLRRQPRACPNGPRQSVCRRTLRGSAGPGKPAQHRVSACGRTHFLKAGGAPAAWCHATVPSPAVCWGPAARGLLLRTRLPSESSPAARAR